MTEKTFTLPEVRAALKLSSPQRNQIYYHAKKLGIILAKGRKQARFTEGQILQVVSSMRSSPKSILTASDEEVLGRLQQITDAKTPPSLGEGPEFKPSALFQEHLREIRENGLREALKNGERVNDLKQEFSKSHHLQWIMLSQAAADACISISALSNQIHNLGMHPEYEIKDGSSFAHLDPYYTLTPYQIRTLGVKVRFQKGRTYVHSSIVYKLKAMKEFKSSKGKTPRAKAAPALDSGRESGAATAPKAVEEKRAPPEPEVKPIGVTAPFINFSDTHRRSTQKPERSPDSMPAPVTKQEPARQQLQSSALYLKVFSENRDTAAALEKLLALLKDHSEDHGKMFEVGLKKARGSRSEYQPFYSIVFRALRAPNVSDQTRLDFIAKFARAYHVASLDESETLLELRGRNLVNSTGSHYARANALLDEILARPRAIMPLYRSLRDVFPEKKS